MTKSTHLLTELVRSQNMAFRDSFHSRRHLATPDHELASDFGQVIDLFQRALPTPSAYPEFARRMNYASSQGCTWIEALQFAASQGNVSN